MADNVRLDESFARNEPFADKILGTLYGEPIVRTYDPGRQVLTYRVSTTLDHVIQTFQVVATRQVAELIVGGLDNLDKTMLDQLRATVDRERDAYEEAERLWEEAIEEERNIRWRNQISGYGYSTSTNWTVQDFKIDHMGPYQNGESFYLNWETK